MRVSIGLRSLLIGLRRFPKANRGNIAMIVGLSMIPICLAIGVGLDMSRAMITRARLGAALDAAGLAVGSQPNLDQNAMQNLAREYFKQNYTADTGQYGQPTDVALTRPTGSQTITLSTSVAMPTTLMRIVGIDTMSVGASSQITWGQTKLWVALVLDNTGSMCEPPSGASFPCPHPASTTKIAALQLATHNLLSMLKNAAANNGDVLVSIVPFSKDVTVGTTNVSQTWLDWTDWEAVPVKNDGSSAAPGANTGPGMSCPFSSSYGFSCVSDSTSDLGDNSTAKQITVIPTTPTVYSSSQSYSMGNQVTYNGNLYVYINSTAKSGKTPSSSSNTNYWNLEATDMTGYICPGEDSGSSTKTTSTGYARGGHYYNGCYDSTALPDTQNTGSSTNKDLCTKSTSCTTSSYCSSYPKTSTSTNANVTTVTTTTCACNSDGGGSKKTCTTTATPVATTRTWSHKWVVNSHSNWLGCVMDRSQDNDISNTTPTGSAKFPTENSENCPPGVISPLPKASDVSSDSNWTAYWSNLGTQVDAMIANGNTNQGVGLAWGWQTLTNDDPYNPGELPVDTRKVLILLTDGANTQNRWSTTKSTIDDRTTKACQAIKDDGITVYTVLVMAGTSSMLQGCASDTSKYFELTQADQIVSTFQQIGTQITNLRVSL